MQDYKLLHSNLLNILALRFKEEKILIEKLTSIIGKDYKSVWRRIRGEYKFSADEVFRICSELCISMDSLVDKNPLNVSTLKVYQFPNPMEFGENKLLDRVYEIIQNGLSDPDCSYTAICNRIPEMFFIRYDKLTMLMQMKLSYFTKPPFEPGYYKMIADNWGVFKHHTQLFIEVMDTYPKATVLWEENIIANVVKDVKFFLDIEMIGREDAEDIKKELMDMIHWLNQRCEAPDIVPNQEFTFAVCPVDLNFHSNMILSRNGNIVFYYLHHLMFAYTVNNEDIRLQRTIMDGLMKGAVILSGSNQRYRTTFMKKQLEEINKI